VKIREIAQFVSQENSQVFITNIAIFELRSFSVEYQPDFASSASISKTFPLSDSFSIKIRVFLRDSNIDWMVVTISASKMIK
jgi:hypothetical protein